MTTASVDAALQLPCPKCYAPKEMPCIYIMPKGLNVDFPTKNTKRMLSRVGRPTERLHTERFTLAWVREARRQRKFVVNAATFTHTAAARAEREFDRREWEDLRAWLAQHAEIFRCDANVAH